MSDDAAFLAAVIAHPDEDGPRLAYADWLDERGDPRGEFVRAQCAMAVMEGSGEACEIDIEEGHTCVEDPCPVCEGVGRYETLKQRERELLDAHWRIWMAIIDGWEATYDPGHKTYAWMPARRDGAVRQLMPVEFRRGFVEEVACAADDWLAHADAILAATPLRKVRLTTEPESTDDGKIFSSRRHWLIGWDWSKWRAMTGEHESGDGRAWGVRPGEPNAIARAILRAEFPSLEIELPPPTLINAQWNTAPTDIMANLAALREAAERLIYGGPV